MNRAYSLCTSGKDAPKRLGINVYINSEFHTASDCNTDSGLKNLMLKSNKDRIESRL